MAISMKVSGREGYLKERASMWAETPSGDIKAIGSSVYKMGEEKKFSKTALIIKAIFIKA